MAGAPRGRPRSSEAHAAILAATRHLLAEEGYDGVSIRAIADRAGVGRQTVYRRWPSRAAVVAAAVLDDDRAVQRRPIEDTGDLEADLDRWIRQQRALMTAPPHDSLVRGLVAAAADSSTDAARLYERFTNPARTALVRRFGNTPGGTDPDAAGAAADAVLGTLTFWSLVPDPDRLEDEVDGLIRVLVRGLGANDGP